MGFLFCYLFICQNKTVDYLSTLLGNWRSSYGRLNSAHYE